MLSLGSLGWGRDDTSSPCRGGGQVTGHRSNDASASDCFVVVLDPVNAPLTLKTSADDTNGRVARLVFVETEMTGGTVLLFHENYLFFLALYKVKSNIR